MTSDCTPFEKQLIDGVRRGREKDQELFYKQYCGFVAGIALRYASSPDEVGSIINDSFLKLFERLPDYDVHTSFRAWIRRIVVNTAIDHYRREKRHRFEPITEENQNEPAGDHASALDQLSAEDILRLLEQLPLHLRLVFNLYEIEGYSHQEIADQLSLSVSSSRAYLTCAKARLRELVTRYLTSYDKRLIR